jgi:hypothetical protein
VARTSSGRSGGEEVGHCGGEGIGVLEKEAVAGVAVEDEGGVFEVLDGDVGNVGGDHHVVQAVAAQDGVLDGFQLRLRSVEGDVQKLAHRGLFWSSRTTTEQRKLSGQGHRSGVLKLRVSPRTL